MTYEEMLKSRGLEIKKPVRITRKDILKLRKLSRSNYKLGMRVDK